eukprot:232607-Rhodomonas_salina.3
MSFSIVIPRCASSSRFAVPAYAIPPVAARSVILPPAVSILPAPNHTNQSARQQSLNPKPL